MSFELLEWSDEKLWVKALRFSFSFVFFRSLQLDVDNVFG